MPPAMRIVRSLAVLGMAAAIALVTAASVSPSSASEPGAGVEFRLPYPVGPKLGVNQGNHGAYSHTDAGNQYAWDFGMSVGSPICAAADGRVIEVIERFDKGDPGGGNLIRLEHADGTRTVYVHLMKNGADVVVGDSVLAGDPIGWSGQTGEAANPHLHFSRHAKLTNFSIPLYFVDVDGLVPKQGKAYVSGNEAVRELPGMRATLDAIDIWYFAAACGVPEAASCAFVAAQDAKLDAPHTSIAAIREQLKLARTAYLNCASAAFDKAEVALKAGSASGVDPLVGSAAAFTACDVDGEKRRSAILRDATPFIGSNAPLTASDAGSQLRIAVTAIVAARVQATARFVQTRGKSKVKPGTEFPRPDLKATQEACSIARSGAQTEAIRSTIRKYAESLAHAR